MRSEKLVTHECDQCIVTHSSQIGQVSSHLVTAAGTRPAAERKVR